LPIAGLASVGTTMEWTADRLDHVVLVRRVRGPSHCNADMLSWALESAAPGPHGFQFRPCCSKVSAKYLAIGGRAAVVLAPLTVIPVKAVDLYDAVWIHYAAISNVGGAGPKPTPLEVPISIASHTRDGLLPTNNASAGGRAKRDVRKRIRAAHRRTSIAQLANNYA
jgi:hypothetical protein